MSGEEDAGPRRRMPGSGWALILLMPVPSYAICLSIALSMADDNLGHLDAASLTVLFGGPVLLLAGAIALCGHQLEWTRAQTRRMLITGVGGTLLVYAASAVVLLLAFRSSDFS